MNRTTFKAQLDNGLSHWIHDDKTDEELSLFDMINLAQCAARRAQEHLMTDTVNDRFSAEYFSVRCWTDKAHEAVW